MEWPMKRLVLVVILILVLVALAAVGCAEKKPLTPGEGKEVVSTCVTCHTDKDTLKEVASPEEEVKSEATTGEG